MERKQKPDICIFFSDQHNASICGYAGDTIIRTPNLDRIAASGTVFNASYTACPLCVPARVAFMSGLASSQTGVFTNHGALRTDQPGWAHSLGAAGYDCTLVGRMHFVGVDQLGGFSKRLVGDCCENLWGGGKESRSFNKSLGEYSPTRATHGCLNIIGGGGDSPTLKYDRIVVDEMQNELNALGSSENPRCILAGVYAPHFPYVAPADLYQYYLDKVQLPNIYPNRDDYSNETITKRQIVAKPEQCLAARAAYYAMVENLDRQVGVVFDTWNEYLERNGREGIFIYISDHGDTLGEHHLYGKQTHFEGSAKIPLVVTGCGVAQGGRVHMPVSITDICPTLCEIAQAPVPTPQSGQSLLNELRAGHGIEDRHVVCDWIDWLSDKRGVASRMVRKGKWKYIAYSVGDIENLLFDLDANPVESHNCIYENPEIAKEMQELARENWEPERLIRQQSDHLQNIETMRSWARETGLHDPYLCVESAEGLEKPAEMYRDL